MDPTSLLFISCLAIGSASPQNSAHSAILNAYLKQSGIESNFERVGKHLEQNVPDNLKFYFGYAGFISKTMIDRQITFTWRF